jgi:hypothetical protein
MDCPGVDDLVNGHPGRAEHFGQGRKKSGPFGARIYACLWLLFFSAIWWFLMSMVTSF